MIQRRVVLARNQNSTSYAGQFGYCYRSMEDKTMKRSELTKHIKRTVKVLAFLLPAVVLYAGWTSGGSIRKADILSDKAYFALGWADSGLQIQRATHDSAAEELGPWLGALDIRLRSPHSENLLGFHSSRYETCGLRAAMWQIPFWFIFVLSATYPVVTLCAKLRRSLHRRKANPHALLE
jgi:hypothetical protein